MLFLYQIERAMESRNFAEGLEQRDVEILVKIMLQLKYFRAVYKSSQAAHINKIFALMKAKKIDELRAHLRTILNLPAINHSQIAELRLYGKVIHTLLLLLAKYAPKNEKNAMGEVECYISNESFPPQSRLLLGSTGYQVNINCGANEGERVAFYSYMREHRDEDGKFRYPVDNNRAEIEYLDARAQAIRTGSQEPEIPNVPDAVEIQSDCGWSLERDFLERNSVGFGVVGTLSALAALGAFGYYVAYQGGFLPDSWDNTGDSFKSIGKILLNICAIVIIGSPTFCIGAWLGAFLQNLITACIVSPIKDCYTRRVNSRIPQEAMEFLSSLIAPAVAVDVKSAAEEKENKEEKNDLTTSLLDDDNLSSAEEGKRNQRLQQQLHLLPPRSPRSAAAGVELERRAALSN